MNNKLDNLVGKQVKAIKNYKIQVNNKSVDIKDIIFDVLRDDNIGEVYISCDDFWTSINESEVGSLFVEVV